MRDVAARTTVLASVRTNGTTQGSTDSEISAIAANGGLVAFTFNDAGAATKLVTAPAVDTNNQPDVHAKEFAPNDAAGPALTVSGPAEGASQAAEQVAVGGTATDPSGIVAVTVNGAALPVTATGGFSTTVAVGVGAHTITVRALDGAGNATTVTRSVTRTAATTTKPKPRARLLGLSASLTKAGAIAVKVRLSAGARVRVTLLKRTLRGTPRRVVLRTLGPPVTRTLKAGRRTVTLTPRARLAVGRYVVRVKILTASTGPATRAVALRIRAR